jgi:hypothetical protein
VSCRMIVEIGNGCARDGGISDTVKPMTDQFSSTPTLEADTNADHEQVVADAVAVIDGALARMMQRDLVSSSEVADLLLDLRTLLTA